MGLLDQVIGGVLGQVLGGGREPQRGGPEGGGHESGGSGGGGLGGAMSPIVQALLMLLMSKGAGGLGDLLGGGRQHEAPQRGDAGRRDDGDIGGFDQDGGSGEEGGFGDDPRGRSGAGWDRGSDRGGPEPRGGEGDFSDLSGMLDGPGDRASGGERDLGAGPYAHLDREPDDGRSGLDGLIERFEKGGLGDVIDSWIGHGENRPIAPNRLADALGPDTVDALEQRTGMNRNDLLSELSRVLPGVINGLTPEGRRPTGTDQRGW